MATVTIKEFALANGVTENALYNYIARATGPNKPYISELNHPHVSGTPKQFDDVAQRYIAKNYLAKKRGVVQSIPDEDITILDVEGNELTTTQSSENFLKDLIAKNQSLNQEVGEWKQKASDLESSLEDYKERLQTAENDLKTAREEYEEKAEKMVSGALYAEAETTAQQSKAALEKQSQELDILKRDFEFLDEKFHALQEQEKNHANELKKLRSLIDGVQYVGIFSFTKWKKQLLDKLSDKED